MKRTIFLFLILFTLAWGQDHPRLFFSADDVEMLRQKMDTEPFKSIAKQIEHQAENATSGNDLYLHDHRMTNCGFMYVLTGDTLWALKAKDHVEVILSSGEWANSSIKGLASYMHGKSVAIAYDFCYDVWPEEFRFRVSEKLVPHANVIIDHGGKSQNKSPASNWQGNRFSAGGLCLLASDHAFDTDRLDKAYENVVIYCAENLGQDPQSRGWNIEGIGYTTYPFGNFIGPFGIAMARFDSTRDLRYEYNSVRWLPWTIYANGCRIENGSGHYGVHPDFGDDNAGLGGEGTFGLAFHYCFKELLPGLKYWYNRMVGEKGDGTFDSSRDGAIYSYLYYRNDINEQDPMDIPMWQEGFVDTAGNGYITFRNQYKDSTDLVAQMYIKLRGNKGHSGPDALSFRILGLDTPWAVGGGRYGPKINGHDAYWSSMNTLYPTDPEARDLKIKGNSGRLVGKPVVKPDGSGYVIADMRQNNVGVMGQKRWFVAEYGETTACVAVYVIADVSATGTYWQQVTLETQRIDLDESTETFTIDGAHGYTMKGWLVYQKGSHYLTSGNRIRGSNYGYKDVYYDENNYVHLGSDDGNYIIVLTIVPPGQDHPKPVMSGSWPGEPEIQVNDWKIQLMDERIEYGTPSNVSKYDSQPDAFQLFGNYPNPFNPETTIKCSFPVASRLRISIMNACGQVVRHLYQGNANAGTFSITWDGKNDCGGLVGSGLYFAKVTSGNQTQTTKMMFLK